MSVILRAFRKYLNKKRKMIAETVIGGMVELDIGCGRNPKGKLTIDIKFECRPHIVARSEFLPLRDRSVSSVIVSHMLEHSSNARQTVREIWRVLKEGGLFVLFGPNDDSPLYRIIDPCYRRLYERYISEEDSSCHHVIKFTKESVKRLLSEYFSENEIRTINLGTEIVAICKKVRG